MLRIAIGFFLLLGCWATSSSIRIDVEHSIDFTSFSKRGQFVLKMNVRDSSSKGLVMVNDFDSISEAFFDDFERASSYQVRLPVMRVASSEIQTGGQLEGHVVGYVPIDNLKAACYAHEIHLFMDQLGTLYGLSILPLTCSNSTSNTPIRVYQTESMTGPDTKAFIQKVEEERARKAKQPVDNRSFIQKYWVYIIIALFAFALLNSGGQGGEEGGGQG